MLLVRGWYKDTGLTGTIFYPDESPPEYAGAADTDASYVWVCDSFYRVDEGGIKQVVDGEEYRVVFEKPVKKGFNDEESALEYAKEHIRTQFSRLGLNSEEVTFEEITPEN